MTAKQATADAAPPNGASAGRLSASAGPLRDGLIVVVWLALATSLVGAVASMVSPPRRPPVAQAKV